MNNIRASHLVSVLLAISGAVHAAVRPHPLISDGAVLQQGMRVPVWGSANDREKITVKFQDQEVSTAARDGRWLVELDDRADQIG